MNKNIDKPMNQLGTPRLPVRGTGRRPTAIKISPEKLVSTSFLDERRFPFVVEPAIESINLSKWAHHNREQIEKDLLTYGAILFRGFGIDSAETFRQFASVISTELLDYGERAAPRSEIVDRIFTSSEYPANQRIPLHHEMSYSHNWPSKIMFFCKQAAAQGGRTPIASERQVFGAIDPLIKKRFMATGVMYVRNFGPDLDLSWQEVFQTEDRRLVEEYCRQSQIHFEWRGKDRLRTVQVRQAVITHPVTGEMVWFNHASLFHLSSLDAATRSSLSTMLADQDLPRNAYYGDGAPLEAAVLDEIRFHYDDAAVYFWWREGDLLLLDNFLVAHGRESFIGPRQILVAMADRYCNPAYAT